MHCYDNEFSNNVLCNSISSQPAKYTEFHQITTSGLPTYSRFRFLVPQKLTTANTSFSEMERMDIYSKYSSPWASPLHKVSMSDGSWRPCGDYPRLNIINEPDRARCLTSRTLQIVLVVHVSSSSWACLKDTFKCLYTQLT